MVRDVLGYKVKNHKQLRMLHYIEKYYIYNNNVYQIIRLSKHFKLDAGSYVDMFIVNIKTNKRKNITLSLDSFLNKKLYDKVPNLNKSKFKYMF